MEGGSAAAFVLGAAVHLGRFAHLGLEGLELHQQAAQLFLLVAQLLLAPRQLHLQPVLLQLEDCTRLLHLLVLEGLQLHAHFLPHLDVLPLRHVLVVEDVHVGHPLGLEVAVELGAPLRQEGVSGSQFLVCLLLPLKLAGEDGLLELVGGLCVGEVGLGLAKVALELEDVLLVVADLLVEGVLLVGVGGLQFADLLAVDFPQPADLLEEVGDLAVFEVELRAEDLRLVVLGLDGSVEIVQLGLGVVFDLLHGGGVVFEGLVAFGLHADDLLAQHVHRVLLVLGQLLALALEVAVLVAQQLDLLLLAGDLLPQTVDQRSVGHPNRVPFLVGLVQVLEVLRLQPFDGVVQFELALPLDGEDLVLELGDEVLECVF